MERTLRPPSSLRLPRIGLSLPNMRTPWRFVIAFAVIAAIVAASFAYVRSRTATATTYVTAPVVRQDLSQTVTATGTVNPQNTIAIGSQDSGIIAEIDTDFNARVTKGQVLAKLDPTTFQAALSSAQAALAQARGQAEAASATANGAQSAIADASATAAGAAATALAAQSTAAMDGAAVRSAQANVANAQSAASVAQKTVDRDRALLAQGYIAQSQLDTDRAALVAAQTTANNAVVSVRQAQLLAIASQNSAAASVDQTSAQRAATGTARATAGEQRATAAASESAIAIQRANVETAQKNLANAVITSPVDGTVISRTATIGQTVAASLETPTLFTIAQNLGEMEVDLAIGESDIGAIAPGDTVTFSVLAYPNTTFRGTVYQVRQASVVTNNVVTYTTVVHVANADGKLLPGMTANATIATTTARNALVVPVSALTYRPQSGTVARGTHRRTQTSSKAAGANLTQANAPWGATLGGAAAIPSAGARGRLFVRRGATLSAVPVSIVLVNGTQAAVTPLPGASLAANDAVVTGDSRATAAARPATNQLQSPLTGGGGGRGLGGGPH